MNRLRHILCISLSLLALSSAGSLAADAPRNQDAIPLSGKIMETMDSGGYTYVLLRNAAGEKKWVAAPQMKVSVGQEVTLMPGYEMRNLTSKKLNRTFDKIIFSGGLSAQKEVQMSAEAIKNAHKGMNIDLGKATAAKAATPAPAKEAKDTKPVRVTRVAKARGANAYTVADLYAKRAKLEKKQVVVRGKVVKVASRIMKHNWVHLQDGTGSQAKKNNDIVVTTKALPKEGDIVTAKGELRNRIDFGAGYKYELIMMEASMK